MTGTRQGRHAQQDANDLAPGLVGAERTAGAAVTSYAIGLALSIVLTVASFYVLGTQLVWPPAIPVALLALAVAQIGVHLVFFLHITTAPDNTNNILALAFGVLIVALILAGSLWIMAHLNRNMMPTMSRVVPRGDAAYTFPHVMPPAKLSVMASPPDGRFGRAPVVERGHLRRS